MNSGRVSFLKWKPVIRAGLTLFRVMPQFLQKFIFNLSSMFDGRFSVVIRYFYVKSNSKRCGDNVYIGRYVTIKNCNGLEIGNNVSVHDSCYIDAVGGVEIGSNVSIAHQSSIVSFNHTWSDASLPIKYNPLIKGKVEIGDDCWIACGVRVLAGSCLKSRTVVGAGAIVNNTYPAHSLVAGVPAKVIRTLE